MNRGTVVFLILLRLAIGWHFLFEGLQKVHSVYVGPTVTNRPFSSEGYFREAPGPGGTLMRWFVGDPDAEALGRLQVVPIPEGKNPADIPSHERVPPLLHQDWNRLLTRFARHYGLSNDQNDLAQQKVKTIESKATAWLSRTTVEKDDKESSYKYPTGEVKKKLSVAERIQEYQGLVRQVREMETQRLWVFGKDVEKVGLRSLKAETKDRREALLKDLDKFTQELTQSLVESKDLLTEDQRNKGAMPEDSSSMIRTIDWLTRWGLVVMGACLLLGLFTRPACLAAAGFLLMTYLAVPPFPWLPVVGPSEGNYVFVNKNLVELLALLVLATTASGRWFGLDSFLIPAWSRLTGSSIKHPKR